MVLSTSYSNVPDPDKRKAIRSNSVNSSLSSWAKKPSAHMMIPAGIVVKPTGCKRPQSLCPYYREVLLGKTDTEEHTGDQPPLHQRSLKRVLLFSDHQ